ncbi:type IV pilus secretin PilQ family protein [Cocleimonas flava]|uniref:Type IV pilus assembly protein PilQ n=1 Tax=Cocleimonas flava TaxID=634765 RepID=A0A4R1ESY9_9GAMM|nr:MULTISPECIES: type IV pilus secretin PilQ family protein [Cocleimonas]MEB8432461.1 type IV pilus secretin PilQ family protein [Cocleimonas sp. KMM 6892]MEC4715320.1 type IV pilus secretin PilQ family protein [Cocleimonas sp. KMM 6895]MEC4745061.1 type IV pilus secretin PilQ family protein [Cocleimonas sp. KMM 6896]TCJ82894.1 type IV pilus assembly protein PilQ [Cocleimonas flava]
MKIITRTLLGLSLPALLLATGSSYATARLQSVDSAIQSSGKSSLRLHFDSKVGIPKSFLMKQPAGIVLDFENAERGMGKRSHQVNSKSVKGVKLAGAGDKLRVMVSLNKLTKYTTSLQGNDVVLTFDDQQAAPNNAQAQAKARQVAAQKRAAEQKRAAVQRNQARKAAEAKRLAAYKPADLNKRPGPVVKAKSVKQQAVASNYVARPKTTQAKYKPTQRAVTHRSPQHRANHVLGQIDFHRTENAGGRALIKLPSAATVVESRKFGNTVVLTIKNTAAKQAKKRIDVLDFATPASYIDIIRSGRDVQVKIMANSAFEFDTSKNGANYIVNLKKVKPKAKTNPLVQKKKHYKGKKLSLNFQDIEVRSVLQLLADFTDKNIVVSDSVKGNITLRLKDVPWDQALDIVLESKGLAMRSNGNVIWVAQATELEAKEQRELQAHKRKQALEPLITEYIPVNYAKAADMLAMIQSDTGTEHSAISARGYASGDERTNTIIVRETASRVADIKNLIKSLDVPVQQVSVESRIVIATDEFSKELGARFGATAFGKNLSTSGSSESTSSMVNDLVGGGSSVAVPGLSDRLNVNMPVTAAAGQIAFSLLSGDYLLDLELSALQAENKGEVISTPRVVTADKKKALIEQGVEIPYTEASSSGAATVAFKKAVLSLEVTPQITPDEHVIMDLKVNQDTVGEIYADVPSINTREINTQVLVGNGQTVVLGGVHEEVKSSKVDKVPVLGDVPVLGRLFRTDTDNDEKRELLIFVTPKIMK